ncbi:MAG: ferredoxin family protein [Planctomycetes bacterium]|nr:ferredoxin family protein [Planctomycetota bacterium]
MIFVVISQAQGKNPAKQQLEAELVAALSSEADVKVSLVPHLYDLSADHSATQFLRSIPGDVVVLSWLYPRAARWILDRQNVRGHEGISLLESNSDDERDDESSARNNGNGKQGPGDAKKNSNGNGHGEVPDARPMPNRKIYCLDLREHTEAKVYLDEIRRIANEASMPLVDLFGFLKTQPQPERLEKYLRPLELLAEQKSATSLDDDDDLPANGEVVRRRWYPVIDYSRCTNCMECIDFCLFGVYGLDPLGSILVEQQDSCKKGCPACSRVCPANAIVFPGHKTPAIAGADGEVGDVKIDLSKLFGAPSAVELAARERDVELVRDGRDTVGLTIGIPKRLKDKPKKPRDELDDLIDSLNALEL